MEILTPKKIAVIAKDKADFNNFISEKDNKESFLYVYSIDHTRGIELKEVLITDNVNQTGNHFFNLLNACQLRIR